MPNYCDYRMKVRGYPNNVQEFINIIQADYNYDKKIYGYNNRHLYRIFESEIDEDIMNGQFREVEISGYCAWSVTVCMIGGPLSYYESFNKDNDINYGTTLTTEARRLNLVIEVYSAEPGMGFAEHYLISNSYFNPILIDDCIDYQAYYPYDYDTVEEFNEESGLRMNKQYFETLKDKCLTFEIGGYSCLDYDMNYSKKPLVKEVLAKVIKRRKKNERV